MLEKNVRVNRGFFFQLYPKSMPTFSGLEVANLNRVHVALLLLIIGVLLFSQAESPAIQAPKYLEKKIEKMAWLPPSTASFHEQKATFTEVMNWLPVRRERGMIDRGSLRAVLPCHAARGSGRVPKASNRPGLGLGHLPL